MVICGLNPLHVIDIYQASVTYTFFVNQGRSASASH